MKTFSLFFALFLIGFLMLLYWLNRFAVNLALSEMFSVFLLGIKVVFVVGLALGVAWCAIELRRRASLREIGPGKHGYKQAVLHRGEIVQLAQPGQGQLDPMQQLAMLKTVMQLQGQMTKLAQQTTVQEVAPLEIEAPHEQIPAIVRYADVVDDVPSDMSLLGIHPEDGALELSDWEKLKMLWIIGSSSTGKSNTVFGKALEAYNHSAKLLVVDQHAVKSDSLARKLEPLKDAFLMPIAQTDDQVLSTLQAFKAEFERRVHCQVCVRSNQTCARCSQKIVLIMDEINRMARNEALLAMIKEIVAIGGEESRGFGMYVWCISQKAVHLKWLRDSAITVIAHRVTRKEEAMLACNDDRKAAERLLKFGVGRCFVYGVDFDDLLELQQPLYEVEDHIVESGNVPYTHSDGQEWAEKKERRNVPDHSTNDALEPVERDTEHLPVDFIPRIEDKMLSEQQAILLKAFYKQVGNVEKSLQMIDNGQGKGLGARYRRHANWILDSAGLREAREA